MKWAIRSGLLALFAILLAGNVKADTVYSYTLVQGTTTIATFNLPEFPSSLPSFSGDVIDGLFTVAPTDLTVDGAGSTDTLVFYDTFMGGALADASNPAAFNLDGLQLYMGDPDESNPQMLLPGSGSYALLDYETLTIPYTLYVSVVPPTATPEPSSLLLFGVGLTALVFMRKRYAVN